MRMPRVSSWCSGCTDTAATGSVRVKVVPSPPALDRERTPVGLGQPATDRQAEPDASGLGREERLEDLLQVLSEIPTPVSTTLVCTQPSAAADRIVSVPPLGMPRSRCAPD